MRDLEYNEGRRQTIVVVFRLITVRLTQIGERVIRMTKIGQAMAAAIGAVALLVGVAPVTTQAASTQYVTRGQYVEDLLSAVGVLPVPAQLAKQTFTDVPLSSPYFGWVAAAVQDGVTTGMTPTYFGVNKPLTRAQAAAFEIRALGQTQGAQSVTSTSFTDNAQIPSALVGDVGVAARLGLLRGMPNGSFEPNADLTAAQVHDLIAQLNSVDNGGFGWQAVQVGTPATTFGGSHEYNLHQGMNAIVIMTAMMTGVPFSSPVVQHTIDPQYSSTLQGEYDQIAQQWASEDTVPGIVWKPIAASVYVEPNDNALAGAAVLVESVSIQTGQPVVVTQGVGSPVADPVPVKPRSPYMVFDLSQNITPSGDQVGDIQTRYWFWSGVDANARTTPAQAIASFFAVTQGVGGHVVVNAVWR